MMLPPKCSPRLTSKLSELPNTQNGVGQVVLMQQDTTQIHVNSKNSSSTKTLTTASSTLPQAQLDSLLISKAQMEQLVRPNNWSWKDVTPHIHINGWSLMLKSLYQLMVPTAALADVLYSGICSAFFSTKSPTTCWKDGQMNAMMLIPKCSPRLNSLWSYRNYQILKMEELVRLNWCNKTQLRFILKEFLDIHVSS